jgi:hypothetical protein
MKVYEVKMRGEHGSNIITYSFNTFMYPVLPKPNTTKTKNGYIQNVYTEKPEEIMNIIMKTSGIK